MRTASAAKAATAAETFLTTWQVADKLQISERSVRYLIESGEIKARRLGKRIVRIPQAEIDRLASVGCSEFHNKAKNS